MSWKSTTSKINSLFLYNGSWVAHSSSPQGPVMCTRHISTVLNKTHLQLITSWEFNHHYYEEMALIGYSNDDMLCFWSHDSDRTHVKGQQVITDSLENRMIFEIDMPTGLNRQTFWLESPDHLQWLCELKTANGWNKITQHKYKKLDIKSQTKNNAFKK